MSIMRTLTINGTTYNVAPVVPASSVTLLAGAWVGDGDAYSQVVELPGVTPHTKVDLQPTADQLAEFHYKVLAFVAENNGGVVTVYAIGDKPSGDHTIQTTLTEVEATGKIRGNTVGTTMPRSDLNQTDPKKADYVKGREMIVKSVNGISPDANGNVVVQGGTGSGGNTDLTGYATEQWVKGYAQPVGDYLTEDDLNGYAQTSDIPTKPEDIGAQPSGNYALKTDIPTVPVQSVNGKTGAVSLSASDVGARPSTWMPSASDVGADKSGTASSAVSTHNTKTDAHNDIRLLITALTTRLDALANSDDDTLDQMAEVVAYIKANRDLIDQITTGKVSVSDIVNNLTTNVSNKPLSAAQGVALKALIDAITVPTKVSQLTNDSGFITGYTETDPTVPSWAKATSKPSYTKSEVGLGNVDNVRQYSASNPPPYPVTSVNGKTGAVTLATETWTFTLKDGSTVTKAVYVG